MVGRRRVTSTADLSDAHGDAVAVAAPIFRDFGGGSSFHGVVTTLRVPEDNVLVEVALVSVLERLRAGFLTRDSHRVRLITSFIITVVETVSSTIQADILRAESRHG
jgi:hypothetical protein